MPKGRDEDTYLPGSSDKLGAIWGQELINSLKWAAYSYLGVPSWVAFRMPDSGDAVVTAVKSRSLSLLDSELHASPLVLCASLCLSRKKRRPSWVLSLVWEIHNDLMSFVNSHDSNESFIETLDLHFLQASSYKHFTPFLTYQLGDGIITPLTKRLKLFLFKNNSYSN